MSDRADPGRVAFRLLVAIHRLLDADSAIRQPSDRYAVTSQHGRLSEWIQLDERELARVFQVVDGTLELRQPRQPLIRSMTGPEARQHVCTLLVMAAAVTEVRGATSGGFRIRPLRSECGRLGVPDDHHELRRTLDGHPGLTLSPDRRNPLVCLTTERVANGRVLPTRAAQNSCGDALQHLYPLM